MKRLIDEKMKKLDLDLERESEKYLW